MKKLFIASLLAFVLSGCNKDRVVYVQGFGSIESYTYGSTYFRLHDGRWVKPTNMTLETESGLARQYASGVFSFDDEPDENNIYPATFYELLGYNTKTLHYSADGLADDPFVGINEFEGTEKILCYNNYIDIRFTCRTQSGKKPVMEMVCNKIDRDKREVDMRLYFDSDEMEVDDSYNEAIGLTAFDIKELTDNHDIEPYDQQWKINLTVKVFDGTSTNVVEKVYQISYNPGKPFAETEI
ncbi:MAG: hypothetical protein LBU80_03850 [Rikenellaceae bacterium]|jgi:hypothetical protein|nr:hypothetical protein [Rikenellaceae bacterium]